jgi:hypothetical protein
MGVDPVSASSLRPAEQAREGRLTGFPAEPPRPEELAAIPASEVPSPPPDNPYLASVLKRVQASDWTKQIERGATGLRAKW